MDPEKVPAPRAEPSPEGDELRAALEHRLADALAAPVVVGDLTPLSGGASRTTWAFDAVVGSSGQRDDGVVRRLVLRTCRPGARSPSMVLEAAASTAAGTCGVPVPAIVLAADDAADLGGAALVAERIDGETVARRIYRLVDAVTAGAAGPRRELSRQSAVALARLHRVDPATLAGLPPAEDPVAARRATIDELGLVSPAFELALRWLDDHRPPPSRPTLVHGDFRVGNLVVGPEGLRAVLDWELVHAGDPVEDLGWYCSRAWRFGRDTLPAGGLASLDEWVADFGGEAGAPVERDALAWWTLMADLHWGVVCAVQVERHLSGAECSLELATIGRRIPEAEWDVMEGLRRLGWPR